MALINLIDKISSGTDSYSFNIGIFIDLSKAFDTIDHNILLKKTQLLWYQRAHTYLVQELPRAQDTMPLTTM